MLAPSSAFLGGQAIQASRMLKLFRADGRVDVRFVAHDPPLGPFAFLHRVKYVRTLARQAAYVLLLLREIPKADVVHSFSASYWSFLLSQTPPLLLGQLFRKPVIVNYRSGEALDHLTHWRSAVPLLKRATAIAVSSGYLASVFAKFGFESVAIPNVIDLSRFTWRLRSPVRPVFLSNRNFEAHYDVANTFPMLREEGFLDLEKSANQVMRRVAAEQQAAFIDAASEMPAGRRYFADFVHFTDEGASAMAGIVGKRLRCLQAEGISCLRRLIPDGERLP
jgi:hypothetical protein